MPYAASNPIWASGTSVGWVFNGISLGAVLLIMSLGLAVTFGLMGIINMAHGEMLMVGSYTAYVVQELFATHFPGRADYYFFVACPCRLSPRASSVSCWRAR